MEYIIVHSDDEIWKPLDYKNIRKNMYEISSYGRIRNKLMGQILKQQRSEKDYLMVSLMCESDTRHNHTFKVHKLVAETFLNKPAHRADDGSDWTVDHILGGYDGKGDCSIYNLRYISSLENKKRASIDNQLKPLRGENNPISKITDDIALFINNKLNEGFNSSEIIKLVKLEFHVSITKHIVHDIRRGKTWKHITHR